MPVFAGLARLASRAVGRRAARRRGRGRLGRRARVRTTYGQIFSTGQGERDLLRKIQTTAENARSLSAAITVGAVPVRTGNLRSSLMWRPDGIGEHIYGSSDQAPYHIYVERRRHYVRRAAVVCKAATRRSVTIRFTGLQAVYRNGKFAYYKRHKARRHYVLSQFIDVKYDSSEGAINMEEPTTSPRAYINGSVVPA